VSGEPRSQGIPKLALGYLRLPFFLILPDKHAPAITKLSKRKPKSNHWFTRTLCAFTPTVGKGPHEVLLYPVTCLRFLKIGKPSKWLLYRIRTAIKLYTRGRSSYKCVTICYIYTVCGSRYSLLRSIPFSNVIKYRFYRISSMTGTTHRMFICCWLIKYQLIL